jgi:hypothetical protein
MISLVNWKIVSMKRNRQDWQKEVGSALEAECAPYGWSDRKVCCGNH